MALGVATGCNRFHADSTQARSPISMQQCACDKRFADFGVGAGDE
jgi:hypothetical protein